MPTEAGARNHEAVGQACSNPSNPSPAGRTHARANVHTQIHTQPSTDIQPFPCTRTADDYNCLARLLHRFGSRCATRDRSRARLHKSGGTFTIDLRRGSERIMHKPSLLQRAFGSKLAATQIWRNSCGIKGYATKPREFTFPMYSLKNLSYYTIGENEPQVEETNIEHTPHGSTHSSKESRRISSPPPESSRRPNCLQGFRVVYHGDIGHRGSDQLRCLHPFATTQANMHRTPHTQHRRRTREVTRYHAAA